MAPLYDRMREPLVALSLLTRIPIKLDESAYARSAVSAWAYPLVGLVTGAIVACAGLVSMALGLPPMIAALLGLGAGIVVTGAMHEDGLADCADGFWGGWDTDMRLKIMKDSQIGTYGVLALLVIVALRTTALAAVLSASGAATAIIGVHMASRAVMPALMAALPHARKDGLSRKVGKVSVTSAGVAALIGASALIILTPAGIGALLTLACLSALWGWIAQIKIKGQTGDVLGGVQQIAETALLLCLLAALTN